MKTRYKILFSILIIFTMAIIVQASTTLTVSRETEDRFKEINEVNTVDEYIEDSVREHDINVAHANCQDELDRILALNDLTKMERALDVLEAII